MTTTHKRSDRAGTAELGPVAAARPGNGPRNPARDRAGTQAPAVAYTAAAGVEDCRCREQLLAMYAERGIEVTVTDEPPVFDSGYEQLGMRCPHGVLWYTEPTREQILRWQRDGVQ